MIGNLTVKVTSAANNLPLAKIYPSTGSANTVIVRGVPETAAGVSITGVNVAITNAGGVCLVVAAARTGDEWCATFPASHFTQFGRIANGLQVCGTGTDESATTRAWVLGTGSVEVIRADPNATEAGTYTNVTDRTLKDQSFDLSDGNGIIAAVGTLVEKLGGTVLISILAAAVLASSSAAAFTPPAYTNVITRDGVTYSQLGGIKASNYVVTATTAGGGGGGIATNDVIAIAAPLATNAAEAVVAREVPDYANVSNRAAAINTRSYGYNDLYLYRENGFYGYYTKLVGLNDANYTTWTFPRYSGELAEANATVASQEWVAQQTFRSAKRLDDNNQYIELLPSGTRPKYGPVESLALVSDLDAKADVSALAGKANVSTVTAIDGRVTAVEARPTLVALNGDKFAATNKQNGAYMKLADDATVSFWEGYWQGNRVRLSVTNYYGNTSGDLPRLMIQESVTNESGDVTGWINVWDENGKYTNLQAQVVAYMNTATNDIFLATYNMMNAGLVSRAPRAWGTVTSAGEAAPPNVVWHTEPNTVFAGGTEYAHVQTASGTIGVLAAKGANVFTDGAEGQFRFQDDTGANYFGFDVRQSYTLGCRTDGITTAQVGGNTLVTLTYDLTASTTPVIKHTESLTAPVTWTELTAQEVSWDTSTAGVMLANINAGTNASGFYKAEMVYAGGAKFITNMQADLAGGIAASNEVNNVIQSIYPAITSTGIVWRVKQ